jgi:beta-glucoside PTS system EIICBA component
MNLQEIAKQIVLHVGGEENVTSLTHCATRLRFSVKDESKVNLDELSKVEMVIKSQNKGGQVQVVIGNKVSKVFEEISKFMDVEKEVEVVEPELKGNLFNRFIAAIASIFTPILPALIGSGMIKALSTVLKNLKIVTSSSNFIVIMDMIADAIFYFLPFFLAVSAAKKFKTNQYIAMLLAGVMLHPTWLALIAGADGARSYSFLGLPFYFQRYSSTVIPIILAVFILKYVFDFFNKIVPDIIKEIFVPLLTLLVMVPLVFTVVGPFGSYVGVWIAQAMDSLFAFNGIIAGFLLGFARPILVMFGMHYSIMPIQIQQVASTGTTVLLPSAFAANLAQAGAVLATVLFVSKKDKSGALTSGVSAVFGITEPAIYGFNLKYKIPFFAGCFSAGVVTAVLAALNVAATSVTLPNILSVGILEGNVSLGIIYILVISSAVLAFVLTYFGLKFTTKK